MAKKNIEETALAVAETTALAVAETPDFGGQLVIAGRDDSGSNLSRVAMYAGTVEEEKKYGRHERGMFLDVLEGRELGMSINIMPVVIYATYAQWVKGQVQPVQSWKNKSDVPPELLAWGDGPNGLRVKPAVQEAINCLCIVQATINGTPETEPWPYLFVFKSTGLKCFEQTIKLIEGRRRSMKKTPGLYTLSSVDDKSAQGDPFRRLTARPAGDPPADVVALGHTLYQANAEAMAAAEAMQDDNFDPDAH